jgi:hypothetical protein
LYKKSNWWRTSDPNKRTEFGFLLLSLVQPIEEEVRIFSLTRNVTFKK